MSDKLNGEDPRGDRSADSAADPGGGDGRRSVTVPRRMADRVDDQTEEELTDRPDCADELGYERRTLSLGMVGPKRKGKRLVKPADKRLRSFR